MTKLSIVHKRARSIFLKISKKIYRIKRWFISGNVNLYTKIFLIRSAYYTCILVLLDVEITVYEIIVFEDEQGRSKSRSKIIAFCH